MSESDGDHGSDTGGRYAKMDEFKGVPPNKDPSYSHLYVNPVIGPTRNLSEPVRATTEPLTRIDPSRAEKRYKPTRKPHPIRRALRNTLVGLSTAAALHSLANSQKPEVPANPGVIRLLPDYGQLPANADPSQSTSESKFIDIIGPINNKADLANADKVLNKLGHTILTRPLTPDVTDIDLGEIVQGQRIQGAEQELFLSGNDNASRPDITIQLTGKSGHPSSEEGNISFYLNREGNLTTAEDAAKAQPIPPSTLAEFFLKDIIPSWATGPDGSIEGNGNVLLNDGLYEQFHVQVSDEGKVNIIGNLDTLIKSLQLPQSGS